MTEADYAMIGVDTATILYVYTWGFGAVITAWFSGFIIGVAVDVIRKA